MTLTEADQKRVNAEAAHLSMMRTVDSLGMRLQNRVFADQVRKFCGLEASELRNCREANNKNPKARCIEVEKLLDKCTEDNVRIVADFRQACSRNVQKQEDCIAGTFRGSYQSESGRVETCDDPKLTETDLLAKILSSSQVNVIGNYVLGKTLGEGSFGKVKLATHSLTGQEVAVKVVDKIHAAVVAREIETWRHLHHPNIAQLYEVLTTESKIYMFTEYCAGGEAFDYLCNMNRLDDQDPATRKMVREIVEAVEYCHDKNFVHRDLKLENVLLTEDLTVKVIDFGFTRPYNEMNLLDTYCGSVAYAAPEMITGKKYSGPRADIWSLGVIIYTLLCGYLPFDDDNEAIIHQKINALDYELPDFLSDDSKSLISQILRINPTDRISVHDILTHPWFTSFPRSPPAVPISSPAIADSPSFTTPEETQLCMEMMSLGLNVESVLDSVCGDACDAASALWYLLLKKVRERRRAELQQRILAGRDSAIVRSKDELSGTACAVAASASSINSIESISIKVSERDDRPAETYPPQQQPHSPTRTSLSQQQQQQQQQQHSPLLPHPPPRSQSFNEGSSHLIPTSPRSSSVNSHHHHNHHPTLSASPPPPEPPQHRISATNHSGNSLQMLVGTHHQIHSSPLLPPVMTPLVVGVVKEGDTHIHLNPPSPSSLRNSSGSKPVSPLSSTNMGSIPLVLSSQAPPSPIPQQQQQHQNRLAKLSLPHLKIGPATPTLSSSTSSSSSTFIASAATTATATTFTSQLLQVETLLSSARAKRFMNLPHQNGLPPAPPGTPVTPSIPLSSTPVAMNGGGGGGGGRRMSVGILAAATAAATGSGGGGGGVNASGIGMGSSCLAAPVSAAGSGYANERTSGSANRRGVMINAMRSGGGGGGHHGDVRGRYGRRSYNGVELGGGGGGGNGTLGVVMVSGNASSSGASSSGINSPVSGAASSTNLAAASTTAAARGQILEEEEGEGVEEGGGGTAGGGTGLFGGAGGRKRNEGSFVSHLMASFSRANLNGHGEVGKMGRGRRMIVEEEETE
ncbi:hypothetical protein HDU98_007331 [Podochytrium sp. JEL0797]|nr:hypothetical protein HDU98_007331 [Podochytrium sp. JEL0797]